MPHAGGRAQADLQAGQAASHEPIQQDGSGRGQRHVLYTVEAVDELEAGAVLDGKREDVGSGVSELLIEKL